MRRGRRRACASSASSRSLYVGYAVSGSSRTTPWPGPRARPADPDLERHPAPRRGARRRSPGSSATTWSAWWRRTTTRAPTTSSPPSCSCGSTTAAPSSTRRHDATLVGGTLLALVGYLVMPTAPPRLVGLRRPDGHARRQRAGGARAASAPQGMGWMTNQLARVPEHARRLGAVGRPRESRRPPPTAGCARAALGPRAHHRGRGRRHRQPLAPRRPGRVGAGPAACGKLAATGSSAPRRASRAGPCAPAPDRSWSTSAAARP